MLVQCSIVTMPAASTESEVKLHLWREHNKKRRHRETSQLSKGG